MSATGTEIAKAEDAKLRTAIVAALIPLPSSAAAALGLGLPVLPLVELIAAYALPFRGMTTHSQHALTSLTHSLSRYSSAECLTVVVTTESKAGQFRHPFGLCLHRDDTTGEQSLLVADSTAHCYLQHFTDGMTCADAIVTGAHLTLLCQVV